MIYHRPWEEDTELTEQDWNSCQPWRRHCRGRAGGSCPLCLPCGPRVLALFLLVHRMHTYSWCCTQALEQQGSYWPWTNGKDGGCLSLTPGSWHALLSTHRKSQVISSSHCLLAPESSVERTSREWGLSLFQWVFASSLGYYGFPVGGKGFGIKEKRCVCLDMGVPTFSSSTWEAKSECSRLAWSTQPVPG